MLKLLDFRNQIDKSSAMQIALAERVGVDKNDGYIFEELGELYLLKGEVELSRELFEGLFDSF